MNINDTLNFELPLAWTTLPSLTLKVEVNPNRTIQEAKYDNNEDSVDVSTRACNGINIGYTVINYSPPGWLGPSTASANIKAGQLFMQKVYPLSEKGLVYQPSSIGLSLLTNLNDDDNSGTLKVTLADALASSSPPRPQYIFGWLPPLAYESNGRGIIGGNAAFGNDTENPNRWRRTFAHEVGHNFGLLHPPETAPLTTAGDHWFDVYERVIKPVPASTGGDNLLDFMVPERLEQEAWVSPTNYLRLMNRLCPVGGVAASSLSSQSTVGDNLIISGSVSNTTPVTGTLDPLFRLSTIETFTMTAGSQYCVNLKDDLGNLLSNYCFDLSFEDDSDTPGAAATFSMAVPYPDGLNRVDLVQPSSGSVLSSQVASAHPPSVTVTYPNASGLTLSGTQSIKWTGSDADHDPLSYAILYSRDNGATWMGVAANITDTSYELDFSGLPGTKGASGLIKVLASDGFYSAEDTSDNPFTVANKPPSAAILSPSSGATFYTGPQIVLEGSGVGLQDGSLPGSVMSWTSSQDGALGSGQQLEVNLTPGLHTITLTVTDSNVLKATDSIQLTVVQSTPQHQLFLPLIKR